MTTDRLNTKITALIVEARMARDKAHSQRREGDEGRWAMVQGQLTQALESLQALR